MRRVMIIVISVVKSIVILVGCMQITGCNLATSKDEEELYADVNQAYTQDAVDKHEFYGLEQYDPKLHQKEVQKTLEVAKIYKELGPLIVEEVGDEQIKPRMVALGEKGYIVKDLWNQYNTVNSQELEQFCIGLKNNKMGKVTVYEVGADHILTRIDFEMVNSQLKVTYTVVAYDQAGDMSIQFMGAFNAYDWKYTDRGYLMYERYITERGYDGPQGDYVIRVKPQDEKCSTLCNQYIAPIGYENNNLFLVDWDEAHLERLGFMDLFEILYPLKYKKAMDYTGYPNGIEKEEFEGLITSYFKISKKALENKSYYDSVNQRYLWHDRKSSEWSSQIVPTPDVIGYRENADGTMTLIVDAFWLDCKMDCAFEHEVTIRLLEGGKFQYVSNHIIPNNRNILPEYISRENEDIAIFE